MKFNHIDENGVVVFHRDEPPGYVLNRLLKLAMQNRERIIIQYVDGSSTVINPTEE